MCTTSKLSRGKCFNSVDEGQQCYSERKSWTWMCAPGGRNWQLRPTVSSPSSRPQPAVEIWNFWYQKVVPQVVKGNWCDPYYKVALNASETHGIDVFNERCSFRNFQNWGVSYSRPSCCVASITNSIKTCEHNVDIIYKHMLKNEKGSPLCFCLS